MEALQNSDLVEFILFLAFSLGIVAVAFLVGIVIARYFFSTKKNNDLPSYLKFQNGWHHTIGNYNVISIDGGNEWYAIKTLTEGYQILGKAEDIYGPEWNRKVALDHLVEHVMKNGPITIGAGFSAEEVQLMSNAGIGVRTK